MSSYDARETIAAADARLLATIRVWSEPEKVIALLGFPLGAIPRLAGEGRGLAARGEVAFHFNPQVEEVIKELNEALEKELGPLPEQDAYWRPAVRPA